MAPAPSNNPLEGLLPGSFSFYADAPAESPLSLQQLQSRRKIAEAIAAQSARRPYPTTVGEGLYSAASDLTDAFKMNRLDAQERAYEAALIEAGKSAPIPGLGPAPDQRADVTDNAVPATPRQPVIPEAVLPPALSDAAAPDAAPSLAFTPPIVAQDDAPMSPQAIAAGATQGDVNTGRSKLAQALTQRALLANAPIGGGQPAPFAPLQATERMVAQPPDAGTQSADLGTPPVMTNIPPRPVAPRAAPAAVAGGPAEAPIGSVPGPLSRPVPTPSPLAAPGWLAPQQVPDRKPVPPILDQRPTPEEIKGLQMLRAHPNDPNYQALAQPWIAYGQQKRQADLAQRQEAYKADLATWEKAQEISLQQGTPKAQLELAQRQIDLRKGQIEIPSTAAQNVPAQDPYLNTDKSQQRKGYPDVGVIPPGVIPKDYLENRQKEMAADVQQVAKADLAVPDALKIIHDLRDHPGKEAALGFMGAAGQGFRGSDARDFAEMVNRANGGIFLQAFQALRGSGNRITNVEALKAEQALANLSTAQSKGQFDKALDDYESSLRRGYEVAQRKVNVPVTAYRPLNDNKSTAPDIGAVGIWNGVPQRYVGGNPASDMSYVPVRR